MRNERLEMKNRFIGLFSTKKKILIAHFSPLISQKGFTVIEIMLVMAIAAVLVGLATVSLFNFQHKANLTATTDTFIADLKDQQTKAMSGATEGQTINNTYGINLASNRYILFRGTYSSTASANFTINLPDTVQVTTTFPNSQIIFEKGSGEIYGYASNSASVTFQDRNSSEQKVIQLNKYGVITSIN